MLELTMGLFGNWEYFPLTRQHRMDEQCASKKTNQTNRSKFVIMDLRLYFYKNPGPYPRLGASLRDHRDCTLKLSGIYQWFMLWWKTFFRNSENWSNSLLAHRGFNMSHIAEYILIWHHCFGSHHVCNLFPSYCWRRLREYVNNK